MIREVVVLTVWISCTLNERLNVVLVSILILVFIEAHLAEVSLELILSVMRSISLTMAHAMKWLIDIEAILSVLVMGLMVGVADLTTVEGLTGDFMHGLLQDELFGFVFVFDVRSVVGILNENLLVLGDCVAMLMLARSNGIILELMLMMVVLIWRLLNRH